MGSWSGLKRRATPIYSSLESALDVYWLIICESPRHTVGAGTLLVGFRMNRCICQVPFSPIPGRSFQIVLAFRR